MSVSPLTLTLIHPSDSLASYMQHLATLGPRHPRRIGLLFIQLGLLITACFSCISIAAMNVGLITAIFGALLALVPIHRCIGFWPGIAMVLWMLLSHITNGQFKINEVSQGFLWLGVLWAQVACHHAAPGASRMRSWLVRALVVSICASAVLALAQFFIGRGEAKPFRISPSGPRFFKGTGFFGLHLTQGGVMGIYFFLFMGISAWTSPRWIWFGRIASGIAVAICSSRAALVGMGVAVTAFIAARGRRHVAIAAGAAIGLVLVGGLVLYATQPRRLASMLEMRDGRWPIWHTSWHLVTEHPLLGTGGTPAFRTAYAQAYPLVEPEIPSEFPKGAPHAHNTLLALSAELGVPYMLLWLALLGCCLRGLRIGDPRLWRAGVGVVTMALAFGMFEKLDGETSRALWLSLGMLLAARLPLAPTVDEEVAKPEPNSVSSSKSRGS